MQYQEILSHFNVTSKNGKTAKCTCPAHADMQASLSVTDAGDKTLLHCHAGCKTQDIVSAVRLSMHDLYYDSRSPGKPPDKKTQYTPQQRFQWFPECARHRLGFRFCEVTGGMS